MGDRGVESRPTPGEGGIAAGRADAHAPPDEDPPVSPGRSSSEATEPRFRRRGRTAEPPRRRKQLVMVAAVLVAFALMRGRGPEPPPQPAPPIRGETFLDWMAREDQRRAERYEGRFQGWTLSTEQEVDHPATRRRNRLQRFLDDLVTAFRSLAH
ncbi:hypothetical protein [Tautonia sociabilis]|uniref:Uncharacterized protein n=1 Tax=Tautonia sociabilis TaxID=2080755 RepID=A0A432MF76_9BACT|nr:hypothetical protein [Tautonia sociabilis]RUL84597.1 hypothetical protein TsocGM_20185 [Tautonia sociabilis]